MFEITNITFATIPLVSNNPLKTAQDNYHQLKRLFVKIVTPDSFVFTECPAFENTSYLSETRLDVIKHLKDYLIPCLLNESKKKSFQYLKILQQDSSPSLAKACLEMGLHALNALSVNKPLHQYFSFQERPVYAMPIVGVDFSKPELKKKLDHLIKQGHRHIKCKIIPGDYLLMLDNILQEYSHIDFCLDANESFSFQQAKRQFLNLKSRYRYIEQPLNRHHLSECAKLSNLLPIDICLDESIGGLKDIVYMKQHQIANRVTIKLSKLGGFESAINCINYCQQHHIPCHIGGLFETNLGRYYNLVLAMHPGVEDVAEICPASAYFNSPNIKLLASFNKGQWLLNPAEKVGYQLDKNIPFFHG